MRNEKEVTRRRKVLLNNSKRSECICSSCKHSTARRIDLSHLFSTFVSVRAFCFFDSEKSETFEEVASLGSCLFAFTIVDRIADFFVALLDRCILSFLLGRTLDKNSYFFVALLHCWIISLDRTLGGVAYTP